MSFLGYHAESEKENGCMGTERLFTLTIAGPDWELRLTAAARHHEKAPYCIIVHPWKKNQN